jgi:hypothetical protein
LVSHVGHWLAHEGFELARLPTARSATAKAP